MKKAEPAKANTASPPRTEPDDPQSRIMISYLKENVPVFRELCELRQKGWENSKGDRYFTKQRSIADKPSLSSREHFFRLMKDIGQEIHDATGALRIKGAQPGNILDMCAAPGGFLEITLQLNPDARALAISLPSTKGGHPFRMSIDRRIETKYLDLTMLAADMGVVEISKSHPDAANFLPKQFGPDQVFDLILCDGQVLRTQDRAAYREQTRERRRLVISQLVLGLEHLRPGGTMVILLHHLEGYDVVKLVYAFSRFSSIRLYKPTKGHTTRSSFYLLASDVQNTNSQATRAIKEWKDFWYTATFETEEMYVKALTDGIGAEAIIEAFGRELIKLGTEVWSIQAKALKRAPFTK
ncbi:uncharacterized protein BO97DRAFT_353191 [Aspergillus homomorphus CBS 101889]|uniref:Ribosomal RNA methyltransferase FtsJ domain-containing protein n=1 Tax=Aspergillus homomorphus (strain CBS 101889) TaxID=1450537 RepID=A0A395HM49_ASPHC|nr:hypothetical protein BO97DRAFT_353191 [Aspergillus homomorphus CBS 101889]RAL08840.1 hypothetical protein BO97DRAFT_353191 [Aspergillus homomorphus CBS 101889]